MMKICVIHAHICKESAEELAEYLGADVCNPYKSKRKDFSEYDLVFNYGFLGTAERVFPKNLINNLNGVRNCIDKQIALDVMAEVKVPVVQYAISPHTVSPRWKSYACHKAINGRGAEGLSFGYKGEPIPQAAFYTEYFDHEYEFRIVVFKGQVVGRFLKKRIGKEWHFEEQLKRGFGYVDAACIKAAEALGIDYVGFDVLANDLEDFVIIEANSGPVITENAKKAIQKYINTLQEKI